MVEIKKIAGLNELITELKENGINVSEVDLGIAEVLFDLANNSAKRGYEDKDGIIVEPLKGFIFSEQVESLIKAFPNAAALLEGLNRDKNYGFVDENGEIQRTGMMGSPDPIMTAKEMIQVYKGTGSKKLYQSETDYNRIQKEERDREFELMFGEKSGEDTTYNYNINRQF